ncbi:MAG: Ig-like domain-containing protein [Zhongshania sp.]|uniref:Ig-like domain-containing protein n=1 Tax=Zhongshania sp. TaxID=1971902 RepID=UPI00262DC73E|nr:Ig-like domain-containing protein [Zhongshania sp.]MDF1691265.1 Ig-like domain-containing protein [Zhongshania sp.]
MKLFSRTSLLVLAVLLFAGCGGGGSNGGPTLTIDDSNNSGGTTDSSVRFGISSGGSFQDGVIASDLAELTQNESTILRVSFVDANGAPVTTPAVVNFTSTCASDNSSTISPASITNSTGLVSVTYTAQGCNIEDTIIASTSINNIDLSASTSLQVSGTLAPGNGGNTGDVRFGTLKNGQFVDGEIKANFTALQPGDSVDLYVAFIDADGLPYSDAATVNFTSTCISAGLATITPASVNNTTGLIQASYESVSCNGEDNVIATTLVNNKILRATVVLTTTFNTHFGNFVGGIFSDGRINTSSNSLKTGQSTTLTVKLQNAQGNAIAGTEVRFSSSSCVGSSLATITPSATTNANGIATAIYTTNGCDGDDIIIAETRYQGQDLSATTTLSLDALQVQFGSFNQLLFNNGTIASSKNGVIEAGETTTLTVDLIDQNGDSYTGSASIFFNSTCLASGLAEIDPAIATNIGGTASVIYTARGCDGDDLVTASTNVADNTLTAAVTLTTDQPPLGTLQFISATPQILGLKGTESINDADNEDGREIGAQSVVTFKVTSTSGQALPNQRVDFEIVTGDTGSGNNGPDAYLSSAFDTSDNEGLVTTVVTPGTTATPVRLKATTTHEGATVTAVSNSLVITTGIPDQDSFSISASCLNPDAWAYNGVTSRITAHASDRFNNPVPDGTSVVFWTEGGSIEASCNTGVGGFPHGECSVLWRSQDPRPVDGRLTILARAIGEESFADSQPTNGRYDDAETFSDIGEPYLDANENGLYDVNVEKYGDFNNDNTRNGPNKLYDGLLCDKTGANAKCNPDSETLFVSDSIVLVMSDATKLTIEILDGPDPLTANPINGIDLTSGGGTIYAHIYDERGQLPPGGTTVSASTDLGKMIGSAEYTVPSSNSNGSYIAAFTIIPSDAPNEAKIGGLVISVDTGDCSEVSGGTTVNYSVYIPLKQNPPAP